MPGTIPEYSHVETVLMPRAKYYLAQRIAKISERHAVQDGRTNSGIMSTLKNTPDRNIIGNDTVMSLGMADYLD